MRTLAGFCVVFWLSSVGLAAESPQFETYRSDHVIVRYSDVSQPYVKALARVAETSRAASIELFGFDMPETITIEVSTGSETRLFTDGTSYMKLTLKSEAALRKPSESGVFNIYGICHEIGHVAMYLPIQDRAWMTTDAVQGWAHYLGSRLVDVVYEREGADLWPDRYDYRADGMARLDRGIKSRDADDMTRDAGLWKEFARIVGDRKIAPIFSAWGKAAIDPAQPGPALKQALFAANADPRLAGWWQEAKPVLIQVRPKSAVAEETVGATQLAGEPLELFRDDGISAGMQSISGTGHLVVFDAPDDNSYLVAVKVYGSRYGKSAPPAENFHIWLTDENNLTIADFPLPYSSFERGNPTWVTLAVPPTKVPRQFAICIAFNPTQTKGVSVHHDKAPSGNSYTGLPGERAQEYRRGDWMIGAILDHAK